MQNLFDEYENAQALLNSLKSVSFEKDNYEEIAILFGKDARNILKTPVGFELFVFVHDTLLDERVMNQLYKFLYDKLLERAIQYKKTARLALRKYLLENEIITSEEWRTLAMLHLKDEMIQQDPKEEIEWKKTPKMQIYKS